jgi:hypothetical protein
VEVAFGGKVDLGYVGSFDTELLKLRVLGILKEKR